MPCRHPLQTRVRTRPDQIASRLQLRRRNIDRLEQPARTQPRELTRVAAVGLDPIIRPRRQQPRRQHLANDSPPHQIAIQVKAGRAPPRSNNAPPASGATSARPPPSPTQACVRRATHRCGQRRVGSNSRARPTQPLPPQTPSWSATSVCGSTGTLQQPTTLRRRRPTRQPKRTPHHARADVRQYFGPI